MDVEGQFHIASIVGLFGGQSALARTVGCDQSTVWEWLRNNRVPSRRIPEIIAAAARLDPPVHLRPDDFFDLPASTPVHEAAGVEGRA